MIDGIYGINIAVKDLAEATRRFEQVLGVRGRSMPADEFAFPGLLGTRIELNGLFIHLISSTEPGTAVARFVEGKGEGVFLVSLKTGNLDAVMNTLKAAGIDPLLDPPQESDFGRVTFVHPKNVHGVQLEILESA